MTSNPCAGLLRVRFAEARSWHPLAPHCRAVIARMPRTVRDWLPRLRDQLDHPTNEQCLACRLMLASAGDRYLDTRGVLFEWFQLVRKNCGSLARAAAMDRYLRSLQLPGGAR